MGLSKVLAKAKKKPFAWRFISRNKHMRNRFPGILLNRTKGVTRLAQRGLSCSKCYTPILSGHTYTQINNKLRICSSCMTEWLHYGGLYGEPGQITFSAEGLLQCHLCGIYFIHLSRHVQAMHKITHDDYREMVGISRTTPLASANYRQFHSRIAKRLIKEGKLKDGAFGAYQLFLHGDEGREALQEDVRLQTRIARRQALLGDKNPAKRIDIRRKISESQRKRFEKIKQEGVVPTQEVTHA